MYLAILFSRSLNLSFALSFFLGMTCVGRYDGCFIAISEYVSDKYKEWVGTLLLVWDSLVNIIILLYYKYISWKSTYLQIFGLFIAGFAFILLLLIPETPEFLYSNEKFSECRKIIMDISWYNRIPANIYRRKRKYIFDTEHQAKEINFSIITGGSNYVKDKLKKSEIRREKIIHKSLKRNVM